MKFAVRVCTLIMATYSLVTMALQLKEFIDTQGHRVIIRNSAGNVVERGPWFKESKLWPTVLLAMTSIISLCLSFVIVVAYFRSVGTANSSAAYFTYVSYIITATHVGMWIPTAAAYRAGKDGKDLWGWSCSEEAKQIQFAFHGVVNFERSCNVQSSAWASSMIEAILTILTVLLYWWEYRRLKHKREMQTHFSEQVDLKESRWTKLIPTGHKT